MYNEVNTSPVKLFFRKRWVRLFLIFDVLAVIVVIGIAIFNSMKTSIITFNITPVDATIYVNGTIYENGTYKLFPGSYEVVISHPDLDAKNFHFDLMSDSSTLVTTFLSATDDDGKVSFDFYTLSPNYDSFQALASMASKANNQTTDHDTSAGDFVAGMQQSLNIESLLPIVANIFAVPGVNTATTGFSIRNNIGNRECQRTACLLVMYYGIGYEEAVAEKIKEVGYNPADYEIIYERYK